jgi:hypothetical protein
MDTVHCRKTDTNIWENVPRAHVGNEIKWMAIMMPKGGPVGERK